MNRHYARPAELAILAAPSALAAAVLWGPAALAAPGGPAVAKVLTTCAFTALKNAVAVGGTIDYGVNCQSPPVSFTSTIKVPAGLTADIEANGHTVTFDGGDKVRLFQVTGGSSPSAGSRWLTPRCRPRAAVRAAPARTVRLGRPGATAPTGPAARPRARPAARARRAARVARPRRARPAARARTPRWPGARRC